VPQGAVARAGQRNERERERDRGKGAAPVEEEKKETPGRKEIEEKEKRYFPRTYAQFQKTARAFL
jgi:hypothetical protein